MYTWSLEQACKTDSRRGRHVLGPFRKVLPVLHAELSPDSPASPAHLCARRPSFGCVYGQSGRQH